MTYNFLHSQIIGNIKEVRATSIFDVFDINFFRAKVVMMRKLVIIHLLTSVYLTD